MGPAGIGVAMKLSECGLAANTICFEQGDSEDNSSCTCDDQGNCCGKDSCLVISGIGGASNFSSGKLSIFPAGSGLVNYYGSDKELIVALNRAIKTLNKSISLQKIDISTEQKEQAKIYFKNKGFDYKYYDVYEFHGAEYQKFIAETIDQMNRQGLTICQDSRVTEIENDSQPGYHLVRYISNDQEQCVLVHNLVIATGALNIYDQLLAEIENPVKNRYEIGVRIEAPSEEFRDVFTTHGDLKLKKANGRTYCVTESGTVITYRSEGYLFLEGCKPLDSKTGFTNLAVLVRRDNIDEFDSFLRNYKTINDGIPVKQMYLDYINNTVTRKTVISTCNAAHVGNINSLFPQAINDEIKDFLQKTVDVLNLPSEKLTIIAPELKLLRAVETTKDFEINSNLFVVGAATGKFRGILQSLCSGIKCGEILSGRW